MIRISDSELEVMKIVWKRKRTTSLEIIEDLDHTDWSYNTIRTLIKRLHVKGAIEIVKKEGKTYTYKATINEDDYKVSATKKLLTKLYKGSFEDLILQYCEHGGISVEEMKELVVRINEMINRKEKGE